MPLLPEERVRLALTRLSLGEGEQLRALLALEALLEGEEPEREHLLVTPRERPLITGERARVLRELALPVPRGAIFTPLGRENWKERGECSWRR